MSTPQPIPAPLRQALVRCEELNCLADFFHVAARAYPTLCLDHAEEARRVGLLTNIAGATVWFAPEVA